MIYFRLFEVVSAALAAAASVLASNSNKMHAKSGADMGYVKSIPLITPTGSHRRGQAEGGECHMSISLESCCPVGFREKRSNFPSLQRCEADRRREP